MRAPMNTWPQLPPNCWKNGWSVIIDAAFLERKRRNLFHALADRYQVPFKIRACSASTAAMKQRIAQRHDDASEARLDVLVQQTQSC
jgi:predicted kinase